jgi:hypothetical protein
MLTVVCILWLAAFIGTLISALGKLTLWVPVLLATIAGLVSCLPLR